MIPSAAQDLLPALWLGITPGGAMGNHMRWGVDRGWTCTRPYLCPISLVLKVLLTSLVFHRCLRMNVDFCSLPVLVWILDFGPHLKTLMSYYWFHA